MFKKRQIILFFIALFSSFLFCLEARAANFCYCNEQYWQINTNHEFGKDLCATCKTLSKSVSYDNCAGFKMELGSSHECVMKVCSIKGEAENKLEDCHDKETIEWTDGYVGKESISVERGKKSEIIIKGTNYLGSTISLSLSKNYYGVSLVDKGDGSAEITTIPQDDEVGGDKLFCIEVVGNITGDPNLVKRSICYKIIETMKWVDGGGDPVQITIKAGSPHNVLLAVNSTIPITDSPIKIYFDKKYEGMEISAGEKGTTGGSTWQATVKATVAESEIVGKSYSVIVWAEQGTGKIKRTLMYTTLAPDMATTTPTASVTEAKPDVLDVPPTAALNPLAVTSVQALVGNAIQTLMGLIGSIALVMFVYGGVLWMTAMGNAEKTKKATQIIIWSSLGVLVILFSYALVNFVFEAFR